MTTLILWRHLTFWDEEQINFINIEKLKQKLNKDNDFTWKLAEYHKKNREVEELESEAEDLYTELFKIASKCWVSRDVMYKFI